MNKLKDLKDKIKNNEIVLGTHVMFDGFAMTELLGYVGFDFIWIDGEHGAIDRKDIQSHMISAKAGGAASIVRVPVGDEEAVKAVLDMGADGIVFPMIRTVDDAKKAAGSCIYPPEGTRGFGLRRANFYGLADRAEYLKNANDNIWKIMQIEHIDIIEDLEEVLALDGVDGIVVGPNDFAASVGKLGQTNDAYVQECFDKIGEIARASGKPFGVSGGYSEPFVKEWMDRGVNFITLGNVFSFVSKAAKEVYNETSKMFLDNSK